MAEYDEDILHDINFDVKKGETVGIIGTTGACERHTVTNLLCRFFDATEGSVYVDGVDVKDMDMYETQDENIVYCDARRHFSFQIQSREISHTEDRIAPLRM